MDTRAGGGVKRRQPNVLQLQLKSSFHTSQMEYYNTSNADNIATVQNQLVLSSLPHSSSLAPPKALTPPPPYQNDVRNVMVQNIEKVGEDD